MIFFTVGKAKVENKIRRSNSASSPLGLSVLLDVDEISYNTDALNDYHGFKVRACT